MKTTALLALALAASCVSPCFAADGFINDASFAAQLAQLAPEVSQAKAIQPKPKDIQYKDSVEFAAVCQAIYRSASKALSEEVHRLWARKLRIRRSWAVVLDLDETVLDNEQYQVETNGIFNPATWDAWVKREEAGLIPGAKEFLDLVRALPGHHIIYITDRTAAQEQATIANMKRLGVLKDEDLLLTKQNSDDNKGVRRRCVEEASDPRCAPYGRLKILALFGDSARDFEELYGEDMAVQGRKSIEDQAGVRYWPLPNAMYGQWQRGYK